MAQAQLTYSSISLPRLPASLPPSRAALHCLHSSGIPSGRTLSTSFKGGVPLAIRNVSQRRTYTCKGVPFSIKCEQSSKEGGGLDVWLGRIAMIGFATAITIEVTTGKGILENVGFITPLPTVALAVTALVGALTAFFIFQSASRA